MKNRRSGTVKSGNTVYIDNDFNNRPHVSLQGLTPNEAATGVALNKNTIGIQIAEATQRRKASNKINRCNHCQ